MTKINSVSEIPLSWRVRLAIIGKTSKEAADYAGVRRETFSSWINGRFIPTPENIEKVEEFMARHGSFLKISHVELGN